MCMVTNAPVLDQGIPTYSCQASVKTRIGTSFNVLSIETALFEPKPRTTSLCNLHFPGYSLEKSAKQTFSH